MPVTMPPCRNVNLLAPELQSLVLIAQGVAESMGLQSIVIETWRDPARHAQLYAQGRTEPGPIVTWTQHSAHSDRKAVDIGLTLKGKLLQGRNAKEIAIYRGFLMALLRDVRCDKRIWSMGLTRGRDFFHLQLDGEPSRENIMRGKTPAQLKRQLPQPAEKT